jgi:hypothetical protein
MSVRDKITDKAYTTKLLWAAKDKADMRAVRDAYYDDSRRLEFQFRKDLEAEFEVANVSQEKRDLLFRIAWEEGHSSGFGDVLYYYETMVPLVK